MAAIHDRLLTPPARSFFLFGMRGVGKSTRARATFPDAVYVDLLDERLYQDLLADPSLFAQSIGDPGPNAWVVVDEVQRLPSLLNEVHRLIETRRLRFALLGSSARKLKAAGVNLLAGRALRKRMFPFTAAELGPAFDLDRVLRHGSIPLVWTSEAPRDVLEAYAQLYLREEIRAEALVRNLPGFVRFLPVAALFNGQARQRGRDRPHHGPRLPRHPGRYAARPSPARLWSQAAGTGAEAAEAWTLASSGP